MSRQERTIIDCTCDISGKVIDKPADAWDGKELTDGHAHCDLAVSFLGVEYTFEDACEGCRTYIRKWLEGLEARTRCYEAKPRQENGEPEPEVLELDDGTETNDD